jgi:hypothetical protein
VKRVDGDVAAVAFCHVMKAGGTTAARAVVPLYDEAHRYPRENGGNHLSEKTSAQGIASLPADEAAVLRFATVHVPLSAVLTMQREVAPHMATTLLVRDPVSRAASHLRQISRRLDHRFSYEDLLGMPQLRDFYFSNHLTRTLGSDSTRWAEWDQAFDELLFLPELLGNGADRLQAVEPVGMAEVERGLDQLDRVDVVGCLHDYRSWWGECVDRFAWPAEVGAVENQADPADPPLSDSVLEALIALNELDTRLHAACCER